MTKGERVREIRKALGLTTEEFGARVSSTRGAISNIENGNRNLTPQMEDLITREFNVSADWLRSGEGDMFVTGSPEEEVAAFAGETLRLPLDAPQMRLMRAMSKIPTAWWPKIGEIIDEVLEEERRAKEDK